MILVDTSIWADHLVKRHDRLFTLLEQASVVMHPYVLGEIALGNLPQRGVVLQILQGVPKIDVATTLETLGMTERHDLAGSGIGYVDAHLVASTLMTPGCRLWTRDKRLLTVAKRLGVAADVD